MTAQIPAFPLRMPKELRDWLKLAAADHGRSLNSEIVQQLKAIRDRTGTAKKSSKGGLPEY